MNKDNWELIEDSEYAVSHRLKVLGGWLVRSIVNRNSQAYVCQTFVPGDSESWTVNPVKPTTEDS